MDYILVVFLLLVKQNEGIGSLSPSTRDISDFFDVNIGAGYAVGSNKLANNNLPSSKSNINFTKNYFSNAQQYRTATTERTPSNYVRGSRILTNSSSQTSDLIPKPIKGQLTKTDFTNSHNKEQYSAAPSNIYSFSSPSEDDLHKPNLIDFQNVLNELEDKKPPSKVTRVIKVPAIYEIHLQSDDSKTENKIKIDPTANLFWKNYYKSKTSTPINPSYEYKSPLSSSSWQSDDEDILSAPIKHSDGHINSVESSFWKHYGDSNTATKLSDEYTNQKETLFWKNNDDGKSNTPTKHYSTHEYKTPTGNLFGENYYKNKPNITTKYSDEYTKWLNKYYMQREEHFSKNGEKYYDFSDTPIVTYENVPGPVSYEDKLEENPILHPIISHHYNHATPYADNSNNKEVRVNFNPELFNKSVALKKEYPLHKKNLQIVNNLKKQASRESYTIHEKRPTSVPLHNDISSFFNAAQKNLNHFSHHHQPINANEKPQALHEVPAPVFGKYPLPQRYEIQKTSHSHLYPTYLPSQLNLNNTNKFIKHAPSSKVEPYKTLNGQLNSKHPGKTYEVTEPESMYSGKQYSLHAKGNQNLIYGKKNENVLTPHEINIPVTPGSTSVTVTEPFRYSSEIKNNIKLENPNAFNYNLNNHHKQAVGITQQIPQEVDNSIKNGINFNDAISPVSDKEHVLNVALNNEKSTGKNLEYANDGVVKINFPTKKPEVSESYYQIVEMPYQTQTPISSASVVNIASTTPSSGDNFLSSVSHLNIPQKSEENFHLPEQTDGKIKDLLLSGETKPLPTQNSRRRIFIPDYKTIDNSFLKNLNGGYLNSIGNFNKPPQKKSNGSHMDYIIYITRKATD